MCTQPRRDACLPVPLSHAPHARRRLRHYSFRASGISVVGFRSSGALGAAMLRGAAYIAYVETHVRSVRERRSAHLPLRERAPFQKRPRCFVGVKRSESPQHAQLASLRDAAHACCYTGARHARRAPAPLCGTRKRLPLANADVCVREPLFSAPALKSLMRHARAVMFYGVRRYASPTCC